MEELSWTTLAERSIRKTSGELESIQKFSYSKQFQMWIHLTILTTLTIVMATSQTVQLYDLTRNPGLLTLQTGNTLIKTGRHRIYHVIDLTKYKPLLDNIELAINGLKIFTDFTDMTSILSTKFEEVKNSYKKLLPTVRQIRQKRGAFNVIGSTIKAITGNLDENDLIQINNDIRDLKYENINLIRQNNIQVKLNRNLENRINKIIETVNDEQKIIKQQLIAARQTILINKLINQNFTAIRQAFKISYHIDLLQKHLDSIFEVIQLAKIHIISKNFLESDELKFILDRLEEQHIEILNTDQVYEYLDIRALFKGPILYLIIGVPQISPNAFNSLLLEPLPIEGQIIKLPWNRAAVYGNSTYFLKENCQLVGEKTLCEEENLQDVSDDECFSKIVRGLPGKCTFTDYHNSSNIKQLTENYVIVKNATVTLSTDCLHSDRKLSGTILIFFVNCIITIDQRKFTNTTFSAHIIPTLIPLDGVKIEQTKFESETNLKGLEKLHIKNREQLQIIQKQHSLQTVTSLGLSSTCIILGICFVVYNYYKKGTSPNETNLTFNIDKQTPTKPKGTDRIEIESGRSNLEGEAVNDKTTRLPTPLITCKRGAGHRGMQA